MSQQKVATNQHGPNQPQGQRMTLNLSPAALLGLPYDDREAAAKAAGPLGVRCGAAWGVITHGFRHPNNRDPAKTSIRWHGDIGFENAKGMVGQTSTVYLPTTVERDILSKGVPVVTEGSGPPAPFEGPFSVEFWLEPVAKSVSSTGYVYACYNLTGRRRPINHLAPPHLRQLLPPEPETTLPRLMGYDPETGEIVETDADIDNNEGMSPEDEKLAERLKPAAE
jgi:hypothetical protein